MNKAELPLDRFEELLDVVYRIAAGDLTQRIEISDENNYIDAIGVGINMLVDEINSRVEEIKRIETEKRKILLAQAKKLERINKVMINRELRMVELKKEIRECKKEISLKS